jgi:hypothetical protein
MNTVLHTSNEFSVAANSIPAMSSVTLGANTIDNNCYIVGGLFEGAN